VLPLGKILVSRAVTGARGGLQLALLLFALGHNFMESSILSSDQFGEMMLMLSIACVDDMRRGSRSVARTAPRDRHPPVWRTPSIIVQQGGAR
jgi:hypothetical protein